MIQDDSLEGMSLKVEYKHGSYFLVADMTNFIETYDAPSAYFKLYPDERHMIHPGDIFQMGLLQFAVERFNTGVIADVGVRTSMEDTFLIVHDLGIEDCLKFSLFAVIDGHGGDWCAHFMRKRLVNELRN